MNGNIAMTYRGFGIERYELTTCGHVYYHVHGFGSYGAAYTAFSSLNNAKKAIDDFWHDKSQGGAKKR